jgi:fucokinase
LVYTGTPRLAKHLLVEVLRRWWASAPLAAARQGLEQAVVGGGSEEEEEGDAEAGGVRAVVGSLVRDAPRAAAALQAGDLPRLGQLMHKYHAQKRAMAGPTYEPRGLEQLVDALRPLAHGVACCGAGGGGFVAVLCKDGPCEPGTASWASVAAVAARHGGTVHAAALVEGGLQVECLRHV